MSSIRPRGVHAKSVYIAGALAWGVYKSGVLVWRRDPDTAVFSTVGTFSYTIPAWARYVDLVCLGSGGGGAGAPGAFNGQGGYGGSWAWRTLERGADFPVDATTINVVVNAPGTGGSGGAAGNPGTNGGDVSAGIPGGNTVYAIGGFRGSGLAGASDGGPPQNGNVTPNESPYEGYRDLVHEGVTYVGGSRSTTNTASAPGSGGRGGQLPFGAGQTGAVGRAWVRSRSF